MEYILESVEENPIFFEKNKYNYCAHNEKYL